MRIFLASALIALAPAMAQAQELMSVAVSPDGDTVLAAGSNRVLYTIDAQTLQVRDRKYHPQKVEEIAFSPDGRRVILRMDKQMIRVVSARSFKTLYEMSDVDAMSLSADGTRLAVLDNNYKGGILHLLDATNGKPISRLEFPERRTRLVGLNADGSRAIVLTQGEKSEDEAKENAPSDLKGYDKHLFKQQKDGYVSQVIAVDFSDDSHTIQPTFFRSNFPFAVRMVGDRLAVTNSPQDSAWLAADGSTELMNFGETYMSNASLSADGSAVMMTNGTTFMVHKLEGAEALSPLREVQGPRIDGPGEWVTATDEAADGTIYMGTSAYRIWKLAPDATEPEVAPVF